MLNTPFHAFRIDYNQRVNTLITDLQLLPPSSMIPKSQTVPVSVKALWDTGATNSCISKNAASLLGLTPTGMVNTVGVHGTKAVYTFMADIILPNHLVISDVNLTEVMATYNFDVLIGMDIISLGDFAISNYNGKTTFSFAYPSFKKKIDLLAEANRLNKTLSRKKKKKS